MFHGIHVHLLYPFICWMDLSCFHVLAIINSAALTIGMHVSFWIMVFSGSMPRSGIFLGRTTTLFLVFCFFFLRNLYIILQSVCINLHFHQQCMGASLFSTPFPTIIVCRFFDDGHSNQCKVIPHCSFDLHFYDN